MLQDFNFNRATNVRERSYKHKGYKYTFNYNGQLVTVYVWINNALQIRAEIRVGEGTIFNGVADQEFIEAFNVLRDIAGAQYIRYKGKMDSRAKNWFDNTDHEDIVTCGEDNDSLVIDLEDDEDNTQH